MGSASLGSGAESCYAPAHVTPRPGSHKSQSSCASPSARTSSRHSVPALSRSFPWLLGSIPDLSTRVVICVSVFSHLCISMLTCACMNVCLCSRVYICTHVCAPLYVHLCLCTQPICNACFLEIAIELVVRNNKLTIQHCNGDSLPMGGMLSMSSSGKPQDCVNPSSLY